MPRSRSFAFAALLAVSTLSPRPASAQLKHAYRVDDIGTLGGSYMAGAAMNSKGEIAGTATVADGSPHAFRWTEAGGLEDLQGDRPGYSWAHGINDHGDVVGYYSDGNVGRAFVASRGEKMRTVTGPLEYAQLYDIENDGRVTGALSGAFRTLADGTVHQLAPLQSSGWAMNGAGSVTGHMLSADLQQTWAFRYSDARGFEQFGTFGGNRSFGWGINSEAVVVGSAETTPGYVISRPFRARPGFPMEDLGTLPNGFAGGQGSATAINDTNDIVGWSDAWYGWTAFLYTDADGMMDLRPRIPIADRLNGMLHSAFAINGAGQIGAEYTGNGSRIWRLTPVDSPPPPAIVYAAVEPTDVLTPPDGQMVQVSANVAATDTYDVEVPCRIESVVNSEGPASGADPDVDINHQLSVLLRATRLGTGTGRTYTLNVTCTNYFGVSARTQLVVRVPHDRR